MRILAGADFHGDLALYAWLARCAAETRPDLVALAGDLLGRTHPRPDSLEEAHRENARASVALLQGMTAPVVYIMGNDDLVDLNPGTEGIRSVHGRRIELGAYNVVGYQFSPPFMGGIHEKPEPEIRDDLIRLAPLVDQKTVLVTHSPAFGILDIGVLDRHAGSPALLDLVMRRSPVAHIHGHIHGQFGRHGKHFNVAAAGRRRAVLIDLTTMAHRVLEPPGPGGPSA